jgi:hypothetical protein
MKNYKLGMTLLEVIASMFIICIGLLSVLMVIPYGAFQVAQARNAEYISNMLAAGAEDLKIAGWDTEITNQTGVGIAPFSTGTIGIRIIDPFTDNSIPDIIDVPEAKTDLRRKMMTGSDDLNYTINENARANMNTVGFEDDEDPNSPRSSGQYTYFITIKPQEFFSTEVFLNGSPYLTGIKFTTDLLGCYQRTEPCFPLEPSEFSWRSYLRSAEITITDNDKRLDFSTTKYVFVTWTTQYRSWNTLTANSTNNPVLIRLALRRGEWCKVINVRNNNNGNQVITILSNNLVSIKNNAEELDQSMNDLRILVFPGVMYHKRIYD